MGLLDAFEADLRKPFGVEVKSSASQALVTSSWNPADTSGSTIYRTTGIVRGGAVAGSYRNARGAGSVRSGKRYLEFTAPGYGALIGLANATASLSSTPGGDTNSIAFDTGGGTIKYNTTTLLSPGYANPVDTIGIMYDADNGRVYFSSNGTWMNSADPVAGTGYFPAPAGPLFPFFGATTNPVSILLNTGSSSFFFGPPSNAQMWG